MIGWSERSGMEERSWSGVLSVFVLPLLLCRGEGNEEDAMRGREGE